MSNSTRRLARVGTVATPTQIVLMWIEEVHQFYALHDYAVSLKGKPGGAYPLVRLPAQAAAAVRQEMKGQAQEAVHRAVAAAEKDAMFLFHPFMNANTNVLGRREANWLHLTLLISTLNATRAGEAPALGARPWAEAATRFLRRVYAEASAVDYVARRYFAGRSPLFSETAEEVKSLVEHAQQVVELYTDGLYKLGRGNKLVLKPRMGEPIDLADVKKQSVESAIALVEQTVRLSKAETLVDRGERRAAAELIQQHLE